MFISNGENNRVMVRLESVPAEIGQKGGPPWTSRQFVTGLWLDVNVHFWTGRWRLWSFFFRLPLCMLICSCRRITVSLNDSAGLRPAEVDSLCYILMIWSQGFALFFLSCFWTRTGVTVIDRLLNTCSLLCDCLQISSLTSNILMPSSVWIKNTNIQMRLMVN